ARMVPVLLAPAGVEAGRLKMAVGVRADPNLGPSRRDHQRLDPAKRLFMAHAFAMRVDVRESRPGLFAANAWRFIADILERDRGRRRFGIHGRLRRNLDLFLRAPGAREVLL